MARPAKWAAFNIIRRLRVVGLVTQTGNADHASLKARAANRREIVVDRVLQVDSMA